MEPEGLRYIPGFLDTDSQRRLIAEIEAIPEERWERVHFRGNVALRRKVSYGYNYSPDSREVSEAPPMPEYLRELRDRCVAAVGLPAEPFAQASVQRYPPGAGIGAHKDAPMFGPDVVGVSLGADARLVFKRGTDKHILRLEPGSLILLSGPARAQWTHELPPVKSPRYSIYFRTLRRETSRLIRGPASSGGSGSSV